MTETFTIHVYIVSFFYLFFFFLSVFPSFCLFVFIKIGMTMYFKDPDQTARLYHLLGILADCSSHKSCKSRKETPQKLTQLSSRSHPRHLVGKRTAQKDITIDTTSDSQVNNNFPNRWSPASLTFNNYFYLFLYLYMT